MKLTDGLEPLWKLVAPLYGEGRGLKPWQVGEQLLVIESLLSMERGVD